MRILFVTHRFGKDIAAGAERHLWHLAAQMARFGHSIDVVAPLETELRPFLRFGLEWMPPQAAACEEIEVPGADRPIRIRRFPAALLFKPLAAWYQKRLQHRWEQEEMEMEPSAPLAPDSPFPLLLTGWHLPEQNGEALMRWTMPRAVFQLPPCREASLRLRGFAPRNQKIHLEQNGTKRLLFEGKGSFDVAAALDDTPMPSVAALEVRPIFRPLRDTRTLGVLIQELALEEKGRSLPALLHTDHRNLRAGSPLDFMETYLRRAQSRPLGYSRIFDRLRGPRCRGIARFLKQYAREYDWVLAGILPFSILPMAARWRRLCGFKLAALPLFHVDDDFYYWSHYLDALREADVCLANSRYSHEVFFPAIGARSILAGAGVDETLFQNPGISGERFRKRFGIGQDEKMVLSVGRKSGPKRYQMLVQAVDGIQKKAPCRLVLAGADEDGKPIASPHCSFLGALSQEDLLDAYDACDVFALMSESESFGMVFTEAWMRRKPVIGNRNCAPVSRLIRDGETGFLAGDQAELEARLRDLLQAPSLCEAFGNKGLDEVLKSHTWHAIARRVLDFFEAESSR